MRFSDDGWIDGAAPCPSPNHDERPPGMPVVLVVVHAISLPPGEFGGPWIEDFFCNRLDPSAHPYFDSIRDLRVSAHFLIRRDGRLIQFVSCNRRAWHAGVSQWQGRERCNDFALGVELEGCDDKAFEPAQYSALKALLGCLGTHYPIADVVGHSEIAPGRKTDPGPAFDWKSISDAVKIFHARAKKRLHDV